MRRPLAGALAGVLLVGWPGARPRPVDVGSRVTGFVYDSVARGPLANAHVQLVPLDAALEDIGRRTVHTDAEGRFVVDSLFSGRYLVGFLHAKLDSLGVDAPVRRVDLRGGRDATVDLAVPSPSSVIAAWCGRGSAGGPEGVVLGYVRDAYTAATLPGATVAAQWSTISLGAAGARASVQEVVARTNASGWFGLCGVPRGAVLVLRATATPDSSALLELDVPDDGVLLRDVALARGASARMTSPAVVRGYVRYGNGQPLTGVRVRLSGNAVEARTNDVGEFRLQAAAAGTQLVDARMIGHVPLREVVDVSPDSGARVDLVLADFPMDIDTVRVLANRGRARDATAGFERRRRLGHGVFLDTETIERRRPLVFSDLMRGVPGLEVRSEDMMTRVVQMRAASGTPCTPTLVIDGMRLPLNTSSIDDVIPADLVKAIEVYPRRIQAPPEYQDAECGTVVVWTGLRGWLAKRLTGRKSPP